MTLAHAEIGTPQNPLESGEFQRETWNAHLRRLNWSQGEHVLLSGPTSSGKTTMMRQLVERRSHVVIFVSKMKDPTFRSEFKGWERLTDWPKGGPKPWQKRILLWPKPGNTLTDTKLVQRDVFKRALDEIARQGNRCVVIDESLMMNDPRILGLGNEIGMLHYYGRSAGISMVDLTQRPAWIPVVIYSNVTHAYIAKTRDRNDLKRLSELGGLDARQIGNNLSRLPDRHDFVYLNPLGDGSPSVVNSRK